MNSKLLWIVILAAGAGLLILANTFRDQLPNPGDISQITPSPSESPSPSPSFSPAPSSPKSNTSIPATCQLSGEIVFINQNFYETKGAKIVYQNVDDKIRQIYWKSEPDDQVLAVGPNLFQELPLPNGEREIGVVLKGKTTVENYTLTASITYGIKQPSGATEVKIADCSGKINIDTSNI